MRVLMLLSDAHGGRGGIAQYNRDVISALAARDAKIKLLVLPRLIVEALGDVPEGVTYDRRAATGRVRYVWRALVAAMREGPFDLVFCGHINLMPLAALVRRMLRCPMVLAVHGSEVWTPCASTAARRALPSANMVLSVSQHTVDRMATWHPDVRAKARIVPNTVQDERFGMAPRDPALVERFGLAGKRVILTLGRMAADERAKGFDEVIEAMPGLRKATPNLVYLCAGDGDDRARLEAKAQALGLADAVIFTGLVAEEHKPDIFRLADAFVLASKGEGFGIVLLEALACGVPVLGSTADATEEALLHGQLGPAVDPQDRAALTAAILAAIDRPRGVPPGLSQYAFGRFRSRLNAAIDALMADHLHGTQK